ncbi:MAG: acyl-CoA transferase [Alphaproteobacteria bacterium]
MTTKREHALSTLINCLGGIGGVVVERNSALPVQVPPAGRIIVRDGDPGDPEIFLGQPPAYEWTHTVPVDVLTQKADSGNRVAQLDGLLATIGVRLTADRTLGGVVDHLEVGPPEILDEHAFGSAPVRGATVVVTLTYISAGALA